MSALRARMRPGHRPIVIDGHYVVPEYPTYWEVPAQAAASIQTHVDAGEIEYEKELSRSAGGQFAVPGLQTVQRAPDPSAAAKFSRKGR